MDPFDPHYIGFFECFNGGSFFEAHEVLEKLWLKDRYGPNGAYYKGLIQLAGAFVHFQKRRLGPAGALLKLARANLESYLPTHEGVDLHEVKAVIETWLEKSQRGEVDAFSPQTAPRLRLPAAG